MPQSNKEPYAQKVEMIDDLELGRMFEKSITPEIERTIKIYDENGVNKPYYMGCYGIGIGRIIACILENNVIKNEKEIKGFSIPYNIAPYKVQIIYNENNKEKAEKLYEYLLNNNINVIIDDRDDLNLGNRINDVYVLGTPKMIILGNKFDGINYEIEDTKTNEKMLVNFENILDELK